MVNKDHHCPNCVGMSLTFARSLKPGLMQHSMRTGELWTPLQHLPLATSSCACLMIAPGTAGSPRSPRGRMDKRQLPTHAVESPYWPPVESRDQSQSRTRLRIAASITFWLRACFWRNPNGYQSKLVPKCQFSGSNKRRSAKGVRSFFSFWSLFGHFFLAFLSLFSSPFLPDSFCRTFAAG